MNKRNLNQHTKEQKEIINNMSMSGVISQLTGEMPKKINGNNYALVCPIHGKTGKGYNATIKDDRVISCWSQGCFRGEGVFSFLEKYLIEKEGLINFIDRFKRIDSLLGTNLYIPLERQAKKVEEEIKLFTKEFTVNKYCLEDNVKNDIFMEILGEKTSLLNAGTGTGKTYFFAHFANFLTSNGLVDKVFFITPRRSIVEEIAEKYKDLGFESFMGNDDFLPEAKNIVATTHKAHRINSTLEMPELFVNQDGDFHYMAEETSYAVFVDECHLLHTSRQIVGNIEEINKLINNSSYTVFTSANTEHFYKACKEEYDIKNYISIERENRMYNLENLDIIRVDTKESDLIEYTKQLILNTPFKKTLIINNNIVQNDKLAEDLRMVGINCESINSKNKESNSAYDQIISNSLLTNEITICTSIIDTGINIQNNFVRTIIVAPKSQFDDISIIQGFARVRTTIGNTGILITNQNKKLGKSLYKFDSLMELNREEVSKLALMFNEHMFDFYTSESYEEYKSVWNICKENELYAKRKSILKVDGGELNSNPVLKIDDVVLYEVTRKELLGLNHFNDEFILKSLKDINAKEIKIKTDVFVAKKEEKEKKSKEEVCNLVRDLVQSNIAVESLVRACKENAKVKDIIVLEKIAEEDVELASEIRTTIKNILNFKNFNKIKGDEISLAKEILVAFTKEDTKEKNNIIREIKWLMYNNVYKISNKYYKEELKGNGDNLYFVVREVGDTAYRKKIDMGERERTVLLEEYCKTKGYEVTSEGIGKQTSKSNFRKITATIVAKYLEELDKAVESIYEVENGKIKGLKIK